MKRKSEISEDKSTENLILENLKQLQGKRVLILTKSNLHYTTTNLQVLNDQLICFNDKFNLRVMVHISDISQITELREDANEP